MKYSFTSRVRFSEIDAEGYLNLVSIVNYLQDCGTFQSEDAGVGIKKMLSDGRAWFLAGWQIHVKRYPFLGEKIRINTWPYAFKGCVGYRNYSIETLEGEPLVLANAEWAFVDIHKGMPTRITEDQVTAFGVDPELKLTEDFGPRKIRLPREGEAAAPFPVVEYQIDTNKHVNNGQYIRLMQNYLPEGKKAVGIRAEYKKAAKLGDVFYPMVVSEGEKVFVSLNDQDGNAYCIGELTIEQSLE